VIALVAYGVRITFFRDLHTVAQKKPAICENNRGGKVELDRPGERFNPLSRASGAWPSGREEVD